MANKKPLEWFIEKYGEQGKDKYEQNKRYTRREKHVYKKTEEAILTGDAIRCKECGEILGRIQHTHLRNKCTGRFRKVSEYTSAYPGASVVAPNLAKLTAITEDKFKRVYDEAIAKKRWGKYCEVQAETNTLGYKQEKYGWDKETFDQYNAGRAVTLTNLIERHGEEKGREIWDQYCLRQHETTQKAYFLQEYGEEKGLEKWISFCEGRASSKTFSSIPEKELFEWLKIHFHDVKHQFVLPNIDVCMMFDIQLGSKIIEFNGTFWHCDPRKYMQDFFHPIKQLTAKEIWEIDKKRVQTAKQHGYDVLIIWENDWANHLEETKSRILEWILKE